MTAEQRACRLLGRGVLIAMRRRWELRPVRCEGPFMSGLLLLWATAAPTKCIPEHV